MTDAASPPIRPVPIRPVPIRPARPGDEDALIGLVRELADYERAATEVRATAVDLAAALFGPDPVAGCLVAELPAEPAAPGAPGAGGGTGPVVGMALWFRTFSTWTGRAGMHLEDLYVTPTARRSGTGRALIAALAQECLRRGWPRLEWAVLDWNAPAIGFYAALGAEAMDGWTTNRLSDDALRRVAAERA